jgi:hypothetical protein
MPTHVIIDEDGKVSGGNSDGAQGGRFGSKGQGNYADFEADGTLVFYGDSTAFRDEFGPLIGQNFTSPASDIVTDAAEGTIVFKDSCALADYVSMPVQINHDAKAMSDVYPHLHWWQTSANLPNWLIQYRWQQNGAAKVTTWTSVKYVSHAFTYVSGTLNQITAFGALSPPANTGVSVVLQLRLLRDTKNASTLFTGNDPLSGNVSAMFFDTHIEVDMLGSHGQYTK